MFICHLLVGLLLMNAIIFIFNCVLFAFFFCRLSCAFFCTPVQRKCITQKVLSGGAEMTQQRKKYRSLLKDFLEILNLLRPVLNFKLFPRNVLKCLRIPTLWAECFMQLMPEQLLWISIQKDDRSERYSMWNNNYERTEIHVLSAIIAFWCNF